MRLVRLRKELVRADARQRDDAEDDQPLEQSGDDAEERNGTDADQNESEQYEQNFKEFHLPKDLRENLERPTGFRFTRINVRATPRVRKLSRYQLPRRR